MRGTVEIFEVVARRVDMRKVLQTADQVDGKTFVTVAETRCVHRAWRLGK